MHMTSKRVEMYDIKLEIEGRNKKKNDGSKR